MKFIKSISIILLTLMSFITLAEQTATISQQQLLSLMGAPKTNILVLDVRSAEEFAQGHIKGAVNISHQQINENLSKIIAFKDQTVVVHCRSGRRAAIAETALRAEGFSDLRHLKGDMNDWQAADLPLVK
ncbi:MAG: rhodanese-like domain-containing protein [Cognaticolwellia sp.]